MLLEVIWLNSWEHLSMESAPTVTIEVLSGKATTLQIIIRVRLVQLSMAFIKIYISQVEVIFDYIFRPIFRPFLTHPLGLCLNWHLFQYVPIGTIAKIWTNPGTTKAQHKDQRSQDMYPKIDDHHKGKYVNRVIAFFWIFNSGRQNPKSSGY